MKKSELIASLENMQGDPEIHVYDADEDKYYPLEVVGYDPNYEGFYFVAHKGYGLYAWRR